MNSSGNTRAERESLAIPTQLRAEVDARDATFCRVCGKHLGETRALHHIEFGGSQQGMGGRRRHDLTNLVTVCWLWAGNCHDLVHSEKSVWTPLLQQVIATPGVTALQLRRWQLRRLRPSTSKESHHGR